MDDKKTVRVRFAPSPTGMLHIGGVRTALFNYLFAKHHHGQFILRLEDTDRERFVEEGITQIQESLNWLGLVPDEGWWLGRHIGDYGPYVQSERLPQYKDFADELIERGLAYYSRITNEDFSRLRETAQKEGRAFVYKQAFEPPDDGSTAGYPIRLAVRNTISWSDEIRGTFETKSDLIDDFVIIKADGYPTYNFANVIDDHMMQISHVIRGDEFIASTAKHAALYDYFDWRRPAFIHLPAILGPDGKKKLSKRDGDVDVLSYKKEGYLPQALLNYLALLGWNDGSQQEIFTLDELITKFTIERIQKSPAIFNRERLDWFNGEYIRLLSTKDLAQLLVDFVPSDWLKPVHYFESVVALDQERLKKLSEAQDIFSFFFEAPVYSKDDLAKNHHPSLTDSVLEDVLQMLSRCSDFTTDEIEKLLRNFCESHNLETKHLFRFIRFAVTGRTAAPGLFETLAVLGNAASVGRLQSAIAKLKS